jgi:magnesium transporter
MKKLLDRMVDLVRRGELGLFTRRAHEFEPADLAEVLTALDEKQRVSAVQALPPELSSQALAEMPEEAHAGETLAALDPDLAAEIVEELDDDDAADILGDLDPTRQEQILAAVEDRSEVDQLLRYDEESAGGLMTTHMVTVRDTATAGEALEEIRRQSEEVEEFYQVFVVDADHRLVGTLPFKDLVMSRPDLDQEDVARLMARYNLPSVPVVNEQRQLIGQVTFDDVIDVVEAETTEDLLRFGGVSADEDLGAGWQTAVRSRLPWLSINLLTAFLAGGVVYLFQHTIQHTLALAVWMPVIAGMGGNAGTQALAVTVRRLALGLIPVHLFARVVGKEILVGVINGLVMGLAVGTVATVIGEGPRLGLVVFLAMTGNLMVAGFAGAFIPILLERLGADPAVASSIFVTTFTDVCGFLLLLGLAGTLLL